MKKLFVVVLAVVMILLSTSFVSAQTTPTSENPIELDYTMRRHNPH